MYTLSPVPIPSDTHYGFYLYAFALGLLVIYQLYGLTLDLGQISKGNRSYFGFWAYFWTLVLNVLLLLVGTGIYVESYHSPIPVNKPAVGVFDQFVVKVHEERSGKTGTKQVEEQFMQVRIEGTGQYALFPARMNYAYPQRMKLYWNPR